MVNRCDHTYYAAHAFVQCANTRELIQVGGSLFCPTHFDEAMSAYWDDLDYEADRDADVWSDR